MTKDEIDMGWKTTWWLTVTMLASCGPTEDGPDPQSAGNTGESSTESSEGETSAGPGSASATSGSTTADSDTSTSGTSCAGDPHQCAEADTLACADIVVPAQCVESAWQCQQGERRVDDCVCSFMSPQPTCHEGAPGECTDVVVAAVCEGSPGDGGWMCPRGTTPMERCEIGDSSSG